MNNTMPSGEVHVAYDRNYRFRLTCRDGLGGTNWATAQLIGLDSGSGPFVVTSPNTTGIEWSGGTTETVTWDVAGTNVAPVSCANVDIQLSTDGGFTYPITLLANTPNDGSANVSVPVLETTTARVRVKASDNIFFDISNFNISISGDPSAVGDDVTAANRGIHAEPNPFTRITHVFFDLEQDAPVSIQVFTPSGRLVETLAEGIRPAGRNSVAWDGSDYNGRQMPAGVYFYRFQSGNKVETKQLVLVKD
ncbi:MAG: FlgD immunoglobulin-like domain containing protein [Candidatus Eisenbacteria bacterium]